MYGNSFMGNWSRRQCYYVGGNISRRVSEIRGRIGEIFWTVQQNNLDASAKLNIVDSSVA